MTTAMMITNRNVQGNQLGDDLDALRYYVSEKSALSLLNNWQQVGQDQFRDQLIHLASQFPVVDAGQNEQQKHVSLFVHGYNNTWTEAVSRYQQIQRDLYGDNNGLGQLVLFTWPSKGQVYDYLPDRDEAAASRGDLAEIFINLHDYLISMQRDGTKAGRGAACCRAKISVIAHSMGNYVLQKALATASKTLNSPQLITLIHQCVMVAADVDNDLFQESQPQDSDGSLMANLCYRICALYTGRDEVLGASAGLKHFGKRRLGRSGLADAATVYDNVFDYNVTNLIPPDATDIHPAVFDYPATLNLLRLILIGRDRKLLVSSN